jgi:uncharacterized protein (DUF1697 family)
MPLRLITKVFLAVIVLHSAASVCVADDASKGRTLVEVWRVGDDALTIKLAETIERAFGRSPDFTLSNGRKQNTLIVTIPTNVDWERSPKRGKVRSTLEFTSSDTNQKLGTSTVSCWDDALTKCAEKVVKDAKGTARKIR